MWLSVDKTAGRNHILLIASYPLNMWHNFKYLRVTMTNENCIHEGIKSGLNLLPFCSVCFVSPSPQYISSKVE
jgi:hypothetical protein